MTRLYAPVMLALAATAGLAAQQRQDPEQEGPLAQFSSQVQLVEVYATVTYAKGEPITGLTRDDFEVYENNQIQDVSTFAAGEFPLTVALGVDRSWSMAGDRLKLAKQASQSFLRALKPGDRSMVVAINSDAEVVAPLTMDRFNQGRAIEALDPWSTTALHDAIIATLDRLAPEPGRQALVIFSDGTDRYSKATAAQVVARARRSNALVYLIAFGRERSIRHDRSDAGHHERDGGQDVGAQLTQARRGTRILDLRSRRCSRGAGHNALFVVRARDDGDTLAGHAKRAKTARRVRGSRRVIEESQHHWMRHSRNCTSFEPCDLCLIPSCTRRARGRVRPAS